MFQKRRDNQKETSRSLSKDKNGIGIGKSEKKAILNKEKDFKNDKLYCTPDKGERLKRNVLNRRDTSLRNKAAMIIQSAYRGYKVRKMFKQKQKESNSGHRNVKFEKNHVYNDGDHLKNKQIQNW